MMSDSGKYISNCRFHVRSRKIDAVLGTDDDHVHLRIQRIRDGIRNVVGQPVGIGGMADARLADRAEGCVDRGITEQWIGRRGTFCLEVPPFLGPVIDPVGTRFTRSGLLKFMKLLD